MRREKVITMAFVALGGLEMIFPKAMPKKFQLAYCIYACLDFNKIFSHPLA